MTAALPGHGGSVRAAVTPVPARSRVSALLAHKRGQYAEVLGGAHVERQSLELVQDRLHTSTTMQLRHRVGDRRHAVVQLTGPTAEAVRERLVADPDHAAPPIIDVDVFGVIRREHLRGQLDTTAASQAMEDLRLWPGERFGHRLLLGRSWQLRDSVRGWDAMYVALAEALDATLLTTNRWLAAAHGPTCRIEALASA